MHATVQIAQEDRRVDLRYYVNLPPILLESETMAEHVQIMNVARRGFLARTRLAYQSGDAVFLHLIKPGIQEARIVWCKNGMVGGYFLEPINVALIAQDGETD